MPADGAKLSQKVRIMEILNKTDLTEAQIKNMIVYIKKTRVEFVEWDSVRKVFVVRNKSGYLMNFIV